ncbi:hypothetical protein D3C77_804430 [compost metagenome]
MVHIAGDGLLHLGDVVVQLDFFLKMNHVVLHIVDADTVFAALADSPQLFV